jgi:hypothetical protein
MTRHSVCFQQLCQVPISRARCHTTRMAAHVKTESRFKEVLRRSLRNLFNHCLEFYLEIRGFFLKNSFNHSVRESMNLHNTWPLFIYPHFSTVRPVLAHPRISFGLTESSLHDNHVRNNACEGLRRHFFWVNGDIFAWQHTTCLGLPKELIKIK